jgi:Mitochondrial resolvase Ydc2 / RNA splicing MRS1
MRTISIDVGIKNLAFCLFETVKNKTTIIEWDILNLSQENETRVCCEKNKGIPCKNEAKFFKNELCYCLKHAKKQEYILPFLKPNSLNKMKLKDLLQLASKHSISVEPNSKKAEVLGIFQQFILDKCFDTIGATKSSSVDLVTIGRNIKLKFDKILKESPQIDRVAIENQISPIANRMKTIQGMLAQYFIMKNSLVTIDFISAANKLKDTLGLSQKTTYTERKKMGIQKCQDIISNNEYCEKWKDFFKNHKKKDDLADSFLQGVWFIENKL